MVWINRIVKLFLLIVLIIIAFTIAFLNGHEITAYYPDLGADGFNSNISLRLSHVVMGCLLGGFLIGWGMMWTLGLRIGSRV